MKIDNQLNPNFAVISDLETRRSQLITLIGDLDRRDIKGDLSIQEVKEKSNLIEEFWVVSRIFKFLLHKKYRIKWLKEGDANTHYFHFVGIGGGELII